jgi:hypothetical protein
VIALMQISKKSKENVFLTVKGKWGIVRIFDLQSALARITTAAFQSKKIDKN